MHKSMAEGEVNRPKLKPIKKDKENKMRPTKKSRSVMSKNLYRDLRSNRRQECLQNVLDVADGTRSHVQKIMDFWMMILFCAKTAVRPL